MSRLPFLLVLGVLASAASAEIPASAAPHAILRGSYQNARIQFERSQTGHVVFLGGSITENTGGHTAMIPAWLQRRFPATKFTFTNAGIASTCSTTGAFRLQDHVLKHGPVDLLIVEFAVNDDQDAVHAEREARRGLEGIVRHTRAHNPNADILQIHFTNPGMLKQFQDGATPASVRAHESVARHYGLASVNVGAALAAGAQDWNTYGGTHPQPAGYRLVSDMVISVLETAWSQPLPADARPAPPALPAPLDPGSYDKGCFLVPGDARQSGTWTAGKGTRDLLPKGSIRGRFQSADLTVGTGSGTTMSFGFTGRAVGAYVLAGPDAARLETSIDGGPFQTADLYHHHSKGLNYPRTVLFASDLPPGRHQLTLRIAERPAGQPGGTRAAILHFVVNE